MSDLLAGIDQTTSRANLIQRLREASRQLFDKQDAQAGRLQEIEQRVRETFAGKQQEIVQLVVHGTEQDWRDVYEFLDNYAADDLLPRALLSVYEGAKLATGVEPAKTPAADEASS